MFLGKWYRTGRPVTNWLVVIVIAAAGLLYFAVLNPISFGSYSDEGLYVVTAKALATEQGYRIISLPYEPAQTMPPPFYPFLLSLIWRIDPRFPENLIFIMLLSVVATLSFLALTYRYLVKQNYATTWQALIVVGFTAFNWRTMILATGAYSEMFYAALSVVALYLTEEYERFRKSWIQGVVVGAVVGLAFLTRSSGIALLVAIVAYYALKRQWRRGLIVLATASVFVVGWAVWCYLNRTTVQGVNVVFYTSYLGSFNEILNNLQTQSQVSRLGALIGVLGNNALLLLGISIPLVCMGLNYDYIQGLSGYLALGSLILLFFVFFFTAAGFIREISKGFRLLYLYVACYLGLHLLWLPYNVYDRFLMPLLPFLLIVLFAEIKRLIFLITREIRPHNQYLNRISAAFIGLTLIVLAGIGIYQYGSVLYRSLASSSFRKVAAAPPEDSEVIDWINTHTEPSDVLICYRDPMYYLYTERKTARSFPMFRIGASSQDCEELVRRIIKENNGRYLIVTSTDLELEYQPVVQRAILDRFLEQNHQMLLPVFQTADARCRVYRVEDNGG